MFPTGVTPNRGFKRTNVKAFTETKATSVILVCIYNKNGTIITHDLLHTLFSSYGKILRILIFEKMQVWKSFVEYSNTESAIQAKKNLDNFLLFSDGSRINIYFSNLEVIRFQNNNDGGIDYTLNDPEYAQQKPKIQEPLTNLDAMDPRMLVGGGGIIQTDFDPVLNQNQQRTVPDDPSRYPQRERMPFNRTSQRAISNIYAYQGGLSQIDSDEEDPSDKNPMKMMSRNYPDQFQMQQPAPLQKQLQQPQHQKMAQFRTEEEKLNESDHISKFFGGGTLETFQDSSFQGTSQLKKSPGSFHDSGFFDIKPQEKTVIPQDQEIFSSDFMNKLNEDSGRGSKNEFNTTVFSTGDLKLPSRDLSSLKDLDFGLEQPISRFNGSESAFIDNGSLNMLYERVERDFLELQYQQQQQAQIQAQLQALKFSQPLSSPDLSNPIFNLEQPIIKPNQTEILNMSTESQNYKPSSLTNLSMNTSGSQINYKVDEGQQASPFKISNQSLQNSQIPELQNFDMSDLKDPAKLSQLYKSLSEFLGIDNSDIDTKKSPVLYVRGLEHPEFKVHMLYNIFSNFGNIQKIIYTRSKGSALVEFENSEASTLAKDNLNNLPLMGKPQRIYYSNYEAIQLRSKKTVKGPGSEEVFIGTEKSHRFKKNRNISINPPSNVLHISNLVKDACIEQIMRKLFEGFGRVEAVKFLFMDNMKNMCLLRMGTMEEALNAMAFLHDFELMGRRIQISFTRSRI